MTVEEMEFLLPVNGGFTPYGLLLAGGALGGLILAYVMGGKRVLCAGLCAALGAVIGGHLAWGLVNFGFLDTYSEPGWLFLLQPWLGGTTLYGGLFGGLLGVLLYWLLSPGKNLSMLRMLDLLAPGTCLALAFGRAAEMFNGQGIGAIIEDESLQFFPLTVCTYADEDFSSWQFCVWIWEALAALGIMTALLILLIRRRKQRNSLEDGRVAGIFLTVLSGSQIFLEQLRDDDALRFGFVISFTQIAAAATVAAVIVVRLVRKRRVTVKDILRLVGVAAGFLSVIFAEFVFDKPQFYTALTIAFAAEMALAAALLLWVRKPVQLAWRLPLALVTTGTGAAVGFLLGKIDVDLEEILIYGIILLACAVLTALSLRIGGQDRQGKPVPEFENARRLSR